jgi:hypothetical protein
LSALKKKQDEKWTAYMVVVAPALEIELMAADLETGFPATIWNGIQPPTARDQL